MPTDYDYNHAAAFRAFVACALWSSVDEDEQPLDRSYTLADLDEETRHTLYRDVVLFVLDNLDDVEPLDPEQVGHDFWLTRNGHGTGFWDRGLGAVGDRLTSAAHIWGEVNLYIGDDGKVHA